MKNKTLCICIASIVISASISYVLYSKHRVTQQCERAYDNYIDYMKDINKIAIDNGFGEQSVVSLYQFCKN